MSTTIKIEMAISINQKRSVLIPTMLILLIVEGIRLFVIPKRDKSTDINENNPPNTIAKTK